MNLNRLPEPLQTARKNRKITREAYLGQLLAEFDKHGAYGSALEFVPFQGWALYGDARWIGDDGRDLIGANWKEAEAHLLWLFSEIER